MWPHRTATPITVACTYSHTAMADVAVLCASSLLTEPCSWGWIKQGADLELGR